MKIDATTAAAAAEAFLAAVTLPRLALALAVLVALAAYRRAQRRAADDKVFRCLGPKRDFDAIVVGASVAGPAAALQLAAQGRHVLVVEANLKRPDRIVGELLQPGGIQALREMGLEECALAVGSHCDGYTTRFRGEWVQLPYADGVAGVSFHFGDFVMKLRAAMLGFNASAKGKASGGSVTVVEASVTDELVAGGRVYGVVYKQGGERRTATAKLVVMCDGGFSKFKPSAKPKKAHSHFIGIIMKGMTLPFEGRGHVMLCDDGPVLSYRLDANEVRILVDYKSSALTPPPLKELVRWMRAEIRPQMPDAYHVAFDAELERADKGETGVVRSMPSFHQPPKFPYRRGVVGIGDHGNSRHPLTGGGMTCALRDALHLANDLKAIPDLADGDAVHAATLRFLRRRTFFTSVVNILSWALHGVFRGPWAMRDACFGYFRRGGVCVAAPMAFLAGTNSSLVDLGHHYFRTMAFGASDIIFGPLGQKSVLQFALFVVSPWRWAVALHLAASATLLFVPIACKELFVVWRLIDRTAL
jgi:squalene monooxygenase